MSTCKDVTEYYDAKSNVVEIVFEAPKPEEEEEKPVEEIEEGKPVEEVVKNVFVSLEYVVVALIVIFIISLIIYRYSR